MFERIVVLDDTGLQSWALDELQKFSLHRLQVYNDIPQSKFEIIQRIQEADCVFVSWNTMLNEEILSECRHLKYIGMCCSLYDNSSSNVDVKFAEKRGIMVRGIRDYGDEGVVEFIISELIRLIKGLGNIQWKEEPTELNNMKIGIIGMGTTGQMLAKTLLSFGSSVSYFNRSRKYDVESNGVIYEDLNALLKSSDAISIHLPKFTSILGQEEFKLFGKGKILINTSLGLTFDKAEFMNWIKQDGNFAIMDADGMAGHFEEFATHGNIISSSKVSGWTREAKERLSKKVLENMMGFLAIRDKKIN